MFCRGGVEVELELGGQERVADPEGLLDDFHLRANHWQQDGQLLQQNRVRLVSLKDDRDK